MFEEFVLPDVPRLPVGAPHLMFPRILHGKRHVCRRQWRAIAKQAWRNGAWGSLLDELELVPAGALGDAIFYESPMSLPSCDPEVWRLYYVSDCVKDACYKDRTDRDADATRQYDELVLAGLKHFWFAIGMLSDERGGAVTTSADLVDILPVRAHRILDGLVRWLPEFVSIQDNLCYSVKGLLEVDPLDSISWPMVMLSLAYHCGRLLRLDDISQQYNGNVIAALLGENIIFADDDGRFRASPPIDRDWEADFD